MKKLQARLAIILIFFLIMISFIGNRISLAEESDYSSYIKKAIAEFSLVPVQLNLYNFYLKLPSSRIILAKEDKNWLRPSLETLGINTIVWFYNWRTGYDWAKISIQSIIRNLKEGYTWDNNGFLTNQLGHPYHGSMYFSSARAAGLGFWESTIFLFLGSFTWEVMLETNRPSINDGITTIFGGATWGEVSIRIANLIIDESSGGVERVTREIATFFINPVLAFDRLITKKSFKIKNKSEKHYFDSSFLIGVSSFEPVIEMDLEYKDTLEKQKLKISPYDYFRLKLRIRFNNEKFKKERLLTTGVLFGKRIKILSSKNSLIGAFTDFDYINASPPLNKISAFGIGPGLVANFDFGSDLFLNTFSVLSGMFGGSSSSFALKYGRKFFLKHGEDYKFGTEREGQHPYYLGPGISGKLNLEFGKKNLGSIYAGFHQHWVHSIFATNANEHVTRITLRANYNITHWSQICLEYELISRKGTYRDYRPLKNKDHVFRAFYVIKF